MMRRNNSFFSMMILTVQIDRRVEAVARARAVPGRSGLIVVALEPNLRPPGVVEAVGTVAEHLRVVLALVLADFRGHLEPLARIEVVREQVDSLSLLVSLGRESPRKHAEYAPELPAGPYVALDHVVRGRVVRNSSLPPLRDVPVAINRHEIFAPFEPFEHQQRALSRFHRFVDSCIQALVALFDHLFRPVDRESARVTRPHPSSTRV